MQDRGQTLHDYVAGISVFILSVALVVGLLPSVVAPFQNEGGAVTATQADRIGDRIVSNFSSGSSPNILDARALDELMTKDEESLRDRYGLAEFRYANLTLTTLNGSRILEGPAPANAPQAAGASAADEEVSSASRIVELDDPSIDCIPACRLIVRVW